MPRDILYPSAIDYLRLINDNTIDNLLAAKPGFVEIPSAYRRAHILVHQTGLVPVDTNYATDSDVAKQVRISITKDPRAGR